MTTSFTLSDERGESAHVFAVHPEVPEGERGPRLLYVWIEGEVEAWNAAPTRSAAP